jgi:hypothetical protein
MMTASYITEEPAEPQAFPAKNFVRQAKINAILSDPTVGPAAIGHYKPKYNFRFALNIVRQAVFLAKINRRCAAFPATNNFI